MNLKTSYPILGSFLAITSWVCTSIFETGKVVALTVQPSHHSLLLFSWHTNQPAFPSGRGTSIMHCDTENSCFPGLPWCPDHLHSFSGPPGTLWGIRPSLGWSGSSKGQGFLQAVLHEAGECAIGAAPKNSGQESKQIPEGKAHSKESQLEPEPSGKNSDTGYPATSPSTLSPNSSCNLLLIPETSVD